MKNIRVMDTKRQKLLEEQREDRISRLPDSLIHRILCFLSLPFVQAFYPRNGGTVGFLFLILLFEIGGLLLLKTFIWRRIDSWILWIGYCFFVIRPNKRNFIYNVTNFVIGLA